MPNALYCNITYVLTCKDGSNQEKILSIWKKSR